MDDLLLNNKNNIAFADQFFEWENHFLGLGKKLFSNFCMQYVL